MNSEHLCQQGVEKVKASGSPAATVAAGIINDQWTTISDEVKQHLAVWGLSKLINDQMSLERATEVRERICWEMEARAKQRREELQQHEDKLRQFEKDRELQDEARRLHSLSGCKRKSCKTASEQAQCLGGVHVIFLPKDQREAVATEKKKACDDAVAYREKCFRIHTEMHCLKVSCRNSDSALIDCVQKYILSYPEEEQEEKIRKWRETHDEWRKQESEYLKRIANLGIDYGYQKAIDNMRSIMLISSEGSMKSLLDFSLKDVQQWKRKAKANVVSWKARREFFEKAERMLTDAGVESVCDLSPDSIQELAGQAESIWKKKRSNYPEEAVGVS